MIRTKTFWHYIVHKNWNTQKFEFLVCKQKFYYDPEKDPDGERYYEDKELHEGMPKEEIGKVRCFSQDSYHLYSKKLSKEEVMCIFKDYFFDLIKEFKEEKLKKSWEIQKLIYNSMKE